MLGPGRVHPRSRVWMVAPPGLVRNGRRGALCTPGGLRAEPTNLATVPLGWGLGRGPLARGRRHFGIGGRAQRFAQRPSGRGSRGARRPLRPGPLSPRAPDRAGRVRDVPGVAAAARLGAGGTVRLTRGTGEAVEPTGGSARSQSARISWRPVRLVSSWPVGRLLMVPCVGESRGDAAGWQRR